MRADVFEIREPWRGPLTISAILHTALFGGIIAYTVFLSRGGENWGGAAAGEGAISATLVSSAAVPLPRQQVPTENIVANESPGSLNRSRRSNRCRKRRPFRFPRPSKLSQRRDLQL